MSLRAVNRCDQASNSTPDVTVVPKNFLYSEFTGDVYPTTDAGGPPATESQINGKLILACNDNTMELSLSLVL